MLVAREIAVLSSHLHIVAACIQVGALVVVSLHVTASIARVTSKSLQLLLHSVELLLLLLLSLVHRFVDD